jgi:eIF-2B alpha/beta/delta-like uncharacterized protein
MTADNLQSLRYSNNSDGNPSLSVLDQLKVPQEKVYIEIKDVNGAWSVIRNMQIRGAPLIAIVAVLGLAVDLNSNPTTIQELNALDQNDGDAVLAFIQTKMDYLATARPTAVNVFHALEELKDILQAAKTQDGNARVNMCKAIAKHAEFMLERDVNDNKAIGAFGAEAILAKTGNNKARVVTICNTGSLATAGYGTALGVVRALQEQDKLESITALETRPYNQGSRLTAFEIMEENMPGGQLICDSMAASLMRVSNTNDYCTSDAFMISQHLCCYCTMHRQRAWMLVWWEPIEFAPMEIPQIRLARTIYHSLRRLTVYPFMSQARSPLWTRPSRRAMISRLKNDHQRNFSRPRLPLPTCHAGILHLM